MFINYGIMERPRKIALERDSYSNTHGKFIAEPFERVFGHSIGNALRRILLSALEAPGVISVRMQGVQHEFMAVDGIIEDMTNIILNVKSALLRCLPVQEGSFSRESRIVTAMVEVTQADLKSNDGQIAITLGDVMKDPLFEVVNPELVLFTVTKPLKRQFDLRVGYGRGYVPAERHVIPHKGADEIVIDTAFSPVRLVNYYVENTRVGQDTDYDRLVLEITTDGRLTPQEALSFSAQIATKSLEAFNAIKEGDLLFDQPIQTTEADNEELLEMLCMPIGQVELSARSANCLKSADIQTVAELVVIPENELMEFRNFGKKSLGEIMEKLEEMKLSLGMDLTSLGITRENVKDRIQELTDEYATKRGTL